MAASSSNELEMVLLDKRPKRGQTIIGRMLSEIEPRRTQSERLETVRRYVREHADEPLDRARLAAVAGFSVSHLHRLFRAHLGENVASYARGARLERAGRKLRMGAVDITEVALRAGYATHAAFTKAFKQRYGLSPSEFRQLDCWTATRILEEAGRR